MRSEWQSEPESAYARLLHERTNYFFGIRAHIMGSPPPSTVQGIYVPKQVIHAFEFTNRANVPSLSMESFRFLSSRVTKIHRFKACCSEQKKQESVESEELHRANYTANRRLTNRHMTLNSAVCRMPICVSRSSCNVTSMYVYKPYR